MIIKPAFEALATVIPRLKDHLHELDNNRERWNQRQETFNMSDNYKYGPEFGKNILKSVVKKSMDLPAAGSVHVDKSHDSKREGGLMDVSEENSLSDSDDDSYDVSSRGKITQGRS